jgi:hypothetical protein
MYQVYSQQRPGRPRWALGSSAMLLLLTVGLAAALVDYKNKGGSQLTRAGITVHLPPGWHEAGHDAPPGTVLAAVEAEEGEDRALFVFSVPFPDGSPRAIIPRIAARYGQRVLLGAARSSGELGQEQLDRSKADIIAGQPADTFLLSLVSPFAPPVCCLVRVAVLPQGRLVGLALVKKGAPSPSDTRLLDRVGQRIEVAVSHTAPGDHPPEHETKPAKDGAEDESSH